MREYSLGPTNLSNLVRDPEVDVPDARGRNPEITVEFRANEGRVSGGFEGIPMVLVHHRGRTSGREYVNPLVAQLDETSQDVFYIFASNGGLPMHPDWYYNLTAEGAATIEMGTETFQVAIRELTGTERDRIWRKQTDAHPGFAVYERETAGIRTIPVLQLTREERN